MVLDGQNIGSLVYTSSGGYVVAPSLQTGTPDPAVGSGQTALTEDSLYPWVPESGSRHSVEARAEAWEMETSPQDVGVDLEKVGPGGR